MNDNVNKAFQSKFPNQVRTSYRSLIRNSKPSTVHSLKHRGLQTISITHHLPPLNTDIKFSQLPKYSLKRHPGLSAITTVPDNFSWLTITSSDSPDIANIKNQITKPPNQGKCGSCWAVSTASCVSDNFLVSKVVNFNPSLSATWCLACYPETQCDSSGQCGGQCNGGNPATLLQDISTNGIASNHCVDYSWCEGDPNCITNNVNNMDLNTLIPNCGCYDTNVDHYLYKVDPNIETLASDQNTIDANTLTIKKHMLANGPVETGFFVLSNFVSGSFCTNQNTKGIYLENYDYDNDQFYDSTSIGTLQLLGAHAVPVIGWGVETGVMINGQSTIVPYWIARNSWTVNWGDNGCFKIAAYPINQFSQFDASVNGLGGVVLFTVSQKPEKATIQQIQESFNKNLSQSASFYATDPLTIAGGLGGGGVVGQVIGHPFVGQAILIFIFFLISIWIYKYYKSRNE